MRIKVDSRVGSKHIYEPLQKLIATDRKIDHTIELGQLEYGDVAWQGYGEDDIEIPIAAEIVRIPDLLAKIETRRFVDHQLPRLLGHNKVVYLIVEGRWLVKPDGMLDIYAGSVGRSGWKKQEWHASGFLYRSVNGFLLSMAAFPRVIVVRTNDTVETVHWLKSTIDWWAKPWSEHSGYQAWAGVTVLGSILSLRAPSLVEKVAAQLPHVGQERARVVAEKFETIRRMVSANAEAWADIRAKGKSKGGKTRPAIGAKGAADIIKALEEKHE